MLYVCLQLAFVIHCGAFGIKSDSRPDEPALIPFIVPSVLHILLFFCRLCSYDKSKKKSSFDIRHFQKKIQFSH